MIPVEAGSFIKDHMSYLKKANKKDLHITLDSEEYVVMSAKKYRSLQETAYLNSIPGLADDIIAGMNEPLADSVEIDLE